MHVILVLFQGASQSMPWLAELVQSSEGSLDVLPVQCLCEFLLLEKTGENNKEQDEGPSKEVQDKRVVSSQCNMLCFDDLRAHTIVALNIYNLRYGVY